MPIFNLSDIIVNAPKEATGPLAPLLENQYLLNTFRYPEDLGSSDKGHYMVININEQRLTSYPGEKAKGASPTGILNNKTYYKISISKGTTVGKFVQVGKTFVTKNLGVGSTIINVDSTVGFGATGNILINDLKLCEYARQKFTTLIISTGMSTELEIVNCINACNPDVIMHTNSTYPCPVEELNLN